MKVFYEIPEINEDTTIAIGTFDGVHLGHSSILNSARETAKKNNQKFVVFTFLDHPALVTGSKLVPLLLTTSEEKLALLEKFDVDYCVIPPFSKGLSMLTPEEFIKNILIEKLKAKNVCVGFNFYFGYKAEGSGLTLEELSKDYGYKVEVKEPLLLNGETVNSSTIRELLKNGDLEKANNMLNYPYSLRGNVVEGKGIGKAVLGIPTANIVVNGRKLLPQNGVYACEVKVRNKKHYGLVNIGNRPTFDNGLKSIEVHILNFSDDVYGEQIAINLKSFIRAERKFSGPDELKSQILSDIDTTKLFFNDKIS